MSDDLKDEKPWSVHDARVNLAALLNDPRKKGRDYDLFTKTWGETFRDLPPGSTIRRSKWIPNVVAGHFQDYLDNTSDRVLRHESQTIRHRTKANEDDSSDSPSQYGKGKVVIKAAVAAQQERDAILKTRAAINALPKIFLRSDFTLENPQTFSTVLNYHKPTATTASEPSGGTISSRREMSSSKQLQEKLSFYLDLVEMAIVKQISLRSEAFFKAMSSHEQLHEYLNATQSSVKHLLEKLKKVDQHIVHNSLEVINKHQANENLTNLMERLQMMVTVHQTQPTIQLLLSTNEYAGSLDLIRTTQEVLHQELAGLHCFRHLSSQLSEMERVIGHMMQKEMEECLCREINRPTEEGPLCVEPHRITAITLGLLRQGQYGFLEAMRREIETAVKTVVKQCVMEAVAELPARNDAAEDLDSREEKQETLASKMRMMIFADWIVLLNHIFGQLLILLRRVKSILDTIGAVAFDSASFGGIVQRKLKNAKPAIKSPQKRKPEPSSEDNSSSETERTNPFVGDDTTNNESDQDQLNPFLADTPNKGTTNEKFSDRLRINNGMDASNPFADDVDNDAMYGLASYEDELISSAADSYSAPQNPAESVATNHESPDEKATASQEDPACDKSESDATSSYAGEAISQEELDHFARMLRDLLCWTCDFQQDRCVKVLIAKGKDSSLDKLSSSEFLSLAKSVKHFTNESETIVRRHSGGRTSERPPEDTHFGLNGSLRGALKTQANRFVSRFHEERRNKLSLILDNELWKQADVPVELSQLVQNMVDGRITSQPGDLINGHVTNGVQDVSKSSRQFLVVDSEKFAVVGTVLILLKMVSEYCKCSDDLPTSTPDLVHRLRDLLTLFNSRTCQLILGAGALQLVGLKTITTKNLALASRCLQLVLHCLPSIRTHFEAKLMRHANLQSRDAAGDVTLPHKHRSVLRHLDHVTKDYQDHVDEIEHKLVTIVGGVFDRFLGKWEVKAPMPSSAFRQICKQINKFHETVSTLLPQEQTRRILLRLNDDFRQRLREILQSFGVRNDGGPQHGLVTSDLNYYEANVKNLSAMEKVDLNLTAVWT